MYLVYSRNCLLWFPEGLVGLSLGRWSCGVSELLVIENRVPEKPFQLELLGVHLLDALENLGALFRGDVFELVEPYVPTVLLIKPVLSGH